jgi:2'-5' RNA ligase superfamily
MRKSRSLCFCLAALSAWNDVHFNVQSLCLRHVASSQRPLRHRGGFRSPSLLPRLRKSSRRQAQGSNGKDDAKQQSALHNGKPSFQTALCIIPPDELWDTLQRARHFAGDKTYHRWPPAIRLFHPFYPRDVLSDVALDVVSKLVEKHNIRPFKVTLNRWTVMPLPESMILGLEDSAAVAAAAVVGDNGDVLAGQDDDSPESLLEDPEYIEIQSLIASEERKGRDRKRHRQFRQKQRELWKQKNAMMMGANATIAANNQTETTQVLVQKTTKPLPTHTKQHHAASSTPEDLLFNGPAIIALEPDERSCRKLLNLRELLRRGLMAAASMEGDNNQASSSMDMVLCEDDNEAFRPLIPMGAFPTTNAALQTARKLKGLWDPLSFDVTELHFVSQAKMRIKSANHHRNAIIDSDNRNGIIKEAPDVQFGCDAMVMLIGEEIEMDDESNQLLFEHVWTEGTPGGFFRNELQGHEQEEDEEASIDSGDGDTTSNRRREALESYERKLDITEGDWEELMDWLDGDDDDEDIEEQIGTSFVIGRTHIFSGEKRIYEGMPAIVSAEEGYDSTLALGDVSLGADAAFWDDE